MASAFSVPYANEILDNILNGGTFVFPTSLWVAAFTGAAAASLRADDSATWTSLEVSTSGTAYARIPIMGATGINFALAANGTTSQSGDITWASATAAWGTVTVIALMNASTAGGCFAYSELGAPRVIEVPDILSIPANLFDITL